MTRHELLARVNRALDQHEFEADVVALVQPLLDLAERPGRAADAYHPCASLTDLHDLLSRLWEFMDDRQDVRDGPDGAVPNTEMRFVEELDAAIRFVAERMKDNG